MTADRLICKTIATVWIAAFFLLSLFSGTAPAIDNAPTLAGNLSKENAMKLGERMYRSGILPSGEPMPALVQGDIPVESTMFSCESCHLRSGLGSLEGRVVTYPIDGITLYKPMSQAWMLKWISGYQSMNFPWLSGSRFSRAGGNLRSAYTDQTLATAIRGGINPDGKTLNYTMPRYPLSDKDMEIMLFYLKNLSVVPAPGVATGSMRFATVITDDVSQADSQAMISSLATLVISSKNLRFSKMAALSLEADPDDPMSKGYLRFSLATWELKGPRDSWRGQLEAYYKKDPVFALLGGISDRDWGPIHDFCEENRIPCILPVTDLPEITMDSWYTLYFSKGLYQEGEAAAKYLNGTSNISSETPVIQVYRHNRQGLAMAKGFEEAWEGLGRQKPEKRMIPSDGPVTSDFWKQLTSSHKRAVMLLWLDSKDLKAIVTLADIPDRPQMIFLSSTLLGKEIYALPDNMRKFVFITYPYMLPDDLASLYQPSSASPTSNKDAASDYSIVPVKTIQAKTNFATKVVSQSIFMLKGYFFRDRLLEVIDMLQDDKMWPLYPRLSFGPGQRYISKGCYIVQLSDGPASKVVGLTDWVIP